MTNQHTDPSDYVYSEIKESFTTWRNDNDKPAEFRLLTHQKRVGNPNSKHEDSSKCQGSVFLRVVIKPGEVKSLPSEYDNAIRKVNAATGMVHGGLCPWLTKIGEEDIIIHQSLDYKMAILEETALKALAVNSKENKLKEAMKLLETQKLELEATKALISSEKELTDKKAGRPAK